MIFALLCRYDELDDESTSFDGNNATPCEPEPIIISDDDSSEDESSTDILEIKIKQVSVILHISKFVLLFYPRLHFSIIFEEVGFEYIAKFSLCQNLFNYTHYHDYFH